MKKIRKTTARLDCSTASSEEFVAVDDDKIVAFFSKRLTPPLYKATRGLFQISYLGQVTRITPELPPSSLELPHHANGWTLSFDIFKENQPLYTVGLQWNKDPNTGSAHYESITMTTNKSRPNA
ncbi:hypothetical protein TNCV_277551 [Trichonephila clavipes]|uniref:Uncharacterized protein n=1 Tax=Trichonephila clavipes TaxID=2585209 RepID=A0A8X6VGQ5_TRICX|nr:hypothetical protein TNCV_277551 [Trichonephila clavipes]